MLPKKQLLVLAFILCLQNSSGFLGALLGILSGAEMFINVITKLPPIISSVVDVISNTKRAFELSMPAKLVQGDFEVQDLIDPNDAVENFGNARGSPREDLEETIEIYRKELVGKFVDMDNKLDELAVFNSRSVQEIQQLINDLPQQIDIILKKQIVGDFIMTINRQWDRVSEFMRRGVSRKEYHHLIMLSLEYIEHNIAKFRVAITPGASLTFSDAGLLTLIAKRQMDVGHKLCNGETFHRKIVHIFLMIVACEAKADVLQALAYNEECAGEESWKGMFKHWQYDYKQQLERYFKELTAVLNMENDPYIKGCQPNENNFLSVIASEQLYYYSKVKIENCIPIESTLGCDNLKDCQAVKANGFTVCYKTNKNSLYPILQYDNQSSQFLEGGESCLNPRAPTTTICTCTCQRYEKLVLALMQSRVNENYVIVAMRFQRTQNYIYIQIAEGKLGVNGFIYGLSWIQPTQKKNGENPFDASLTINEAKTIALDDVQLPHEYTLTGIKFSRQNLYGEQGFKLGLYGVQFDYDTGKLNPLNETFVLAENLEVCDVCARGDVEDSISTPQYNLAEFRSSDFKFQNTPRKIPCLNGAPVKPNPLTPIRGAGVYVETFGNSPCLSLRLFTLDYIRYIDIEKLEKMNITLPVVD